MLCHLHSRLPTLSFPVYCSLCLSLSLPHFVVQCRLQRRRENSTAKQLQLPVECWSNYKCGSGRGRGSSSLGPAQTIIGIELAGGQADSLAWHEEAEAAASLWRCCAALCAFRLSNIFRQMSRKRDNILTHNANFIHTQHKHAHTCTAHT